MQSSLRSSKRIVAVFALVVSVVVLLGALALTPRASAASTGCSWDMHYGIGSGTFGDPDANASYWAKTYLTYPGGGLTIQGTFPTARYFNFSVYRASVAIAGAHLHDSEIQPSTGVNPFDPGVTGTGTYVLHVLQQPVPADPAPNTLYTGRSLLGLLTLVFRVYDPADVSNPSGSPSLPQISQTFLGAAQAPMGACTSSAQMPTVAQQPAIARAAPVATRARATLAPAARSAATASAPVWSKSTLSSLYPDPDSAYLSTTLTASGGPLVVVRASVPAFPDTNTGDSPWDASQQVRYWSLCENTLTVHLVGCVADFQAVENGGTATFVVSTPANQPANATPANGINWIPFGSGFTGLLLYRQILGASTFSPSIANAPTGSLASTMGSYLPQIAYCSEAEWAAAGADGCLGTAGS